VTGNRLRFAGRFGSGRRLPKHRRGGQRSEAVAASQQHVAAAHGAFNKSATVHIVSGEGERACSSRLSSQK
jgi:hypothetical protein